MSVPTAQRRIVCVVGPTASGKSGLAEALACRIGGEVVSADSMQVYRGMDIGTAKVPPADRSVPYHCIDLVDPGEPFSAALYQQAAREAIDTIRLRGNTPIVCGGTGLYIRAALDHMEFPRGDQQDNPTRELYMAFAAQHGSEKLWSLLSARDPESAALIHPNNVRRVVRAFEMIEEGTSYAKQHEGLSTLPSFYAGVDYIGIKVDPLLLAERISSRVDAMMAGGLLDEVSLLMRRGFTDALCAPQAIGYKEFISLLSSDGQSLAEADARRLSLAVDEVKRNTRRYAKRQRTWFRHDGRIRWLDGGQNSPESLIDDACRLIQ